MMSNKKNLKNHNYIHQYQSIIIILNIYNFFIEKCWNTLMHIRIALNIENLILSKKEITISYNLGTKNKCK